MKKILIYGVGNFSEIYFSNQRYCKHLEEYFDIVGICDSDARKKGKLIEFFSKNYVVKDIDDFDVTEIDSILCSVSNKVFENVKIQYVNRSDIAPKLVRFDEYIRDFLFSIPVLYKLSIVLIVKNDGCYIKEWIEFHRAMGVEHIYLYDNNSSDELCSILEEYIREGFVEYQLWKGTQCDAYDDATSKYKNETKYMAFIDSDEFLFSLENKNLVYTIDNIVESYENLHFKFLEMHCGGIGVNWRMYGTSKHKYKPVGGVIENYVYRAPDGFCENVHIKSVVNPRTVLKCGIHHMEYFPGFQCISENGSAIVEPFFRDSKCEKLRINHYYTKSEEEFWRKINRGWIDRPVITYKKNIMEIYNNRLKEVEECNEIKDEILLDILNDKR